MGNIIINRGFPGGGKSYHAKKIQYDCFESTESCSCSIRSADHFFDRLGRFDAKLLGRAHGECFDGVKSDIAKKIDVIIVDNTNLAACDIKKYADLASASGYEFEIHQVECDPEKAFARQVHGVPKKAHDDMVRAYRNVKLLPWWKVSTIKSD